MVPRPHVHVLMETSKNPPRTTVTVSRSPFAARGSSPTRVERKPQLPFSGRVCPEFVEDASSSANLHPSSRDVHNHVPVKEEPRDAPHFPGMIAGSFGVVIDLDSPTPSRKRSRQAIHDDKDELPAVREKPED